MVEKMVSFFSKDIYAKANTTDEIWTLQVNPTFCTDNHYATRNSAAYIIYTDLTLEANGEGDYRLPDALRK